MTFKTDKNTNYGATSKEWTFLQFDFTKKNSGSGKREYDKKFPSFADMCFSKILIPLSVFLRFCSNLLVSLFEQTKGSNKLF